jgi:hypothetical protein
MDVKWIDKMQTANKSARRKSRPDFRIAFDAQFDRDGLLGTGALLLREVSTLSEGTHLITVTATDSGGLTNAATANIRIAHEEPPLLAIERMLPDVLLSWPVTATNYHLQRAASLPGVWSNVTNAVQTVDDKAQVTLPASDPAKFFRLIKP